jgi:O-acetyl-ADP-ribose deacetylase
MAGYLARRKGKFGFLLAMAAIDATLSQVDLRCLRADITTLDVDVIVNAANSSLLGGGGVDGAIHRAAGPELLAACRPLGGCRTGEAKATPGFDLPARWIVHAVGPVWNGRADESRQLLRRAYRRSLAVASQLAVAHPLTIAFPAISTGAYGYPRPEAAEVALDTLAHADPEVFDQVTLVAFDDETLDLYERGLAVRRYREPS